MNFELRFVAEDAKHYILESCELKIGLRALDSARRVHPEVVSLFGLSQHEPRLDISLCEAEARKMAPIFTDDHIVHVNTPRGWLQARFAIPVAGSVRPNGAAAYYLEFDRTAVLAAWWADGMPLRWGFPPEEDAEECEPDDTETDIDPAE